MKESPFPGPQFQPDRQPFAATQWTTSNRQKLLVLFDGDCPLCRASAAWLKRRDKEGVLRLLPLQTSGLLESLDLNFEEAVKQIQVVSLQGERRQGADAVIWVLSHFKGFSWLKFAQWVPGFSPASRLVYRLIAISRPRSRCSSCRR